MKYKYQTKLTGLVFGRLTVIGESPKELRRWKYYWLCRCTCGTEKYIYLFNLTTGQINSCGCLLKEKQQMGNPTHGQSKTSEYHAWSSMLQRCYRPEADSYPQYGGRGITVCDSWHNSFESFIKDMGKKPTRKHSLERKDPNKNYEPGNCKWATMTEQQNNRRNNHMVYYRGQYRTLAKLCREQDVNYSMVLARLKKGNFTIEQAIETPKNSTYRRGVGLW